MSVIKIVRWGDAYQICLKVSDKYEFFVLDKSRWQSPRAEKFQLWCGEVLTDGGGLWCRAYRGVEIIFYEDALSQCVTHKGIRGIVLDYLGPYRCVYGNGMVVPIDQHDSIFAQLSKQVWFDTNYREEKEKIEAKNNIARYSGFTAEDFEKAVGVACENNDVAELCRLSRAGATLNHAKANNCYALGKAITERHLENLCLKMLIRRYGATIADLEEAIRYCQRDGEMRRIRRIQKLYGLECRRVVRRTVVPQTKWIICILPANHNS